MKIEGGGNNVSYTITKVGFYIFLCKYRTVDVNVLKKALYILGPCTAIDFSKDLQCVKGIIIDDVLCSGS